MKNKYLIFMLSIFSFYSVIAQEQKESNCESSDLVTLKVNFSSEGAKGVLHVSVYDNEENFMKVSHKKLKLEMLDGKNKQLLVEGLCLNRNYSIAAFLDENDNSKLDKNFLGIPKESYGFSNNVKGMFGPPNFGETKINIDSKDKLISIIVD